MPTLHGVTPARRSYNILIKGYAQHGPLRVDGTLCVSRSLGDIDVTALVSEAPEVCVLRLPPPGGRARRFRTRRGTRRGT